MNSLRTLRWPARASLGPVPAGHAAARPSRDHHAAGPTDRPGAPACRPTLRLQRAVAATACPQPDRRAGFDFTGTR